MDPGPAALVQRIRALRAVILQRLDRMRREIREVIDAVAVTGRSLRSLLLGRGPYVLGGLLLGVVLWRLRGRGR